MSAPSRRRLLCGVLLVVGLAGCNVATQEQPVRIDPDDVPFGLLRDSPSGVVPSPTSITVAPDATGTTVEE